MKRTEKIIKKGIGYTVYFHDHRFYVDLGNPIIHSYETLQGVAETLYYQGYIPTKDVMEVL